MESRFSAAEICSRPTRVDFKQGKSTVHATYSSVEEAALVGELAGLGIRGSVDVPTDAATCRKWIEMIRRQ